MSIANVALPHIVGGLGRSDVSRNKCVKRKATLNSAVSGRLEEWFISLGGGFVFRYVQQQPSGRVAGAHLRS